MRLTRQHITWAQTLIRDLDTQIRENQARARNSPNAAPYCRAVLRVLHAAREAAWREVHLMREEIGLHDPDAEASR